jgi:hypothetical protein
VTDVTDALDSVAVAPLHTPALYSAFLRALLNARMEVAESGAQAMNDAEQPNANGIATSSANGAGAVHQLPNNNIQPIAEGGEPAVYPPFDFQFASEMGPVADMSTFPPTMASSRPEDDAMGMLSMDSILSGGFWDNVLVPGTHDLSFSLPECLVLHLLINTLHTHSAFK